MLLLLGHHHLERRGRRPGNELRDLQVVGSHGVGTTPACNCKQQLPAMSLAAQLASETGSKQRRRQNKTRAARPRTESGSAQRILGAMSAGKTDTAAAALLFRVCAAHVVCARDAALSTGTDWDGVGSPAGRPGGWR